MSRWPRAGAARALAGALVGPPRETDVQLLELAIQVRALESGALGDAAHVALLLAQQLLEVDALEGFARFAQRQFEEARGQLRRHRGRRHQRAISEEPPHVLGG